MLAQLEELKRDELNEPELVARFLLLHLANRHGGDWLSGPRTRAAGGAGGFKMALQLRPKQLAKISDCATACEIFARFFFRGVVLDSHEGFVGWSEGRYPLELLLHMPTPDEMLDLQCEGRRCITLFLGAEEQFVVRGRHKDAAAFILHDFEHAHKFFGQSTFHAQVRFFNLLRANLPRLAKWTTDPVFAQDLNYLKSDMNSHPVHLLKFLKAIVLSAEIRQTANPDPALDEFWREFFSSWFMDALETASAMNLNRPGSETQKDQVRAYEFFAK